MNFIQKNILDAVLENVKDDMQLIGEWSLNAYSDIDQERDSIVISAIKRVDNAIEKLLLLGIDNEIIEKHFMKVLKLKK
jgi:hypothetical protein